MLYSQTVNPSQAQLREDAANQLRAQIDSGYFDGEGGYMEMYSGGDPKRLDSYEDVLVPREEAEAILRDMLAPIPDP